jgi:alpha-ketoglutaric semialdehyde dehydrogenase
VKRLTSRFLLFINGEWVNSNSGETYTRVNPADPDEILGEFQKANANDVNSAIGAAHEAFDEWSNTPAPTRAGYLIKAAELLKAKKNELAIEMTREMGKTLQDSNADVQEAIDVANYAASEGWRLVGNTVPSAKPEKFAMTVRQPLGVAGLISPWNFPIAIPARKIFFSLVCGNTAVLKPSSDTPICATKLVQIMEQTGLPKGVLNLVTGSGENVGLSLVKDNRVQVVSFTGHKDTGASILKDAGIKRVNLELGGKNPIIVMDDADLKLAINGVIWGGYETSGQRCTASSRVILHNKIKDKFEKLLFEQVRRLRIGNGLNPQTDVGPLINKAGQEKVAKYVEIGKSEGATILTGGQIPLNMKGWFFEPTIFTNCTPNMRISQEEIFGPVITLLSAENLNEAITVANSVEYGLSSAIYTSSITNAFQAINKLQSGLTYVNSPTIGAEEQLPFGGIKHSGNTREDGSEGIREFTNLKTVYIDYSGKLQKTYLD